MAPAASCGFESPCGSFASASSACSTCICFPGGSSGFVEELGASEARAPTSGGDSGACPHEAVLQKEHLVVAVVNPDGHDGPDRVEHDGLDFGCVGEVWNEHVLDEHRAACRSRRDYASFAIGSQIESIEGGPLIIEGRGRSALRRSAKASAQVVGAVQSV